MDWINMAILTQRLFFCAAAAAVAGSIAAGVLLLWERTRFHRDSRLYLLWMKAALLFYLIPLGALATVGSGIYISADGISVVDGFWYISTPPMRGVYGISAGIWFAGLLMGIGFRGVQRWKLHRILRGNIPVEDAALQIQAEAYREKFGLGKADVFQNDLLLFPVTAGSFRPKIVLPLRSYTEKELHMVLGHEMNHIRSRDLLWKKLALLATVIHWWNPLVYLLLRKLILQEEIVCDIRTCEENTSFTKKEYGLFLAGLEEEEDDMIFVSALCKSKKDIFRRLEGMKKEKRYKKWAVMLSCAGLCAVSALPSYAASKAIYAANWEWIRSTENAVEGEAVDYEKLGKTGHVADDPGVKEITLSEEDGIDPLSSSVSLDRSISANTRVAYRWQEMKEGDVISITAICEDSSISYRVGVRDRDGNVHYIDGTGVVIYSYTIKEDGEYTAYVENRSGKTMQVTGSAYYSN